jgi:Cys-tRNA(Pro)/Cys-tRNA(Cys) deacylase
MKEEKTNVMRILAQKKTDYEPCWLSDEIPLEDQLKARAAYTYKTLVTEGPGRTNFVFVIPLLKTLDLKKAACAAGVKSVSMIPQKELLPLTGYVHGGCSPIGMKKQFRTFIDSSAEDCVTIFFSAGKIGAQVEVAPEDLKALTGCAFMELV